MMLGHGNAAAYASKSDIVARPPGGFELKVAPNLQVVTLVRSGSRNLALHSRQERKACLASTGIIGSRIYSVAVLAIH